MPARPGYAAALPPFPRQGPKLPRQDPGAQCVAEQARCLAQLALDAERIEQESAQVAKARERKCRQQDQIFPILVWLTKCDPGLREHGDSSMHMMLLFPPGP